MNETLFTIVGLLIGALILAAGLYYLAKSREDAESRKIYGIASAVGAVILLGFLLKILLAGF